jgi:exopolysaccharide production protein ExoQ
LPWNSATDVSVPKILEKGFVVFALLYMARGVIPVVAAQGDESQLGEFNAISFTIQALVFVILGALIFVQRQSILPGITNSGLLLSLCGLAIASAAWSSEPVFTLRRGILLLATTILGIYVGSRFDWDEQLNLFAWMGVVSVVGSFLMVFLLPQYGLSHDMHWGNWKGLFPHKNALGQQMDFAILTFAIGKPKGLPRGVLSASLAGAALLLFLSHSMTSIALAAVIACAYPILWLVRLKKRRTLPLWVPLVPVFAAVAWFIASNSGAILDILGRDSTLTGRRDLWPAVIDAIKERPLFGYGYAVFWRWGLSGDARDLLTSIHWNGIMQAHNGYLELCLDLGLSGLLLFVWGFVAAARRAMKLFHREPNRATRWAVMYLLFFALYNLFEGSLMQLYTFLWVPYVSVFVSLALMEAADQREREADLSPSTDEQSGAEMAPVTAGGR